MYELHLIVINLYKSKNIGNGNNNFAQNTKTEHHLSSIIITLIILHLSKNRD